MRFLFSTILMAIFCILADVSAEVAQSSKERLTDEQVAVYRAALEHYLKEAKSESERHLANRTRQFNTSRYQPCLLGLYFDPQETATTSAVYQVDGRVIKDLM